MDIATLLESHRKHLGNIIGDAETIDSSVKDSIMWAHDQATTRSLLDLYRSSNGQQLVGSALRLTPDPTEPTVLAHDPNFRRSHKVKAGSKAARQRALKAGETRRKNLADKKAAANTPTLTGTFTQPGFQGTMATLINDPSAPKLSPATHLAPRPPEGGAA